MNDNPTWVYALIWGGLGLLILTVVAGKVTERLIRRAGRRDGERAVAQAHTADAELAMLRGTPDELMTEDAWARLTQLEFAASYAVSGIAEQIEKVGAAADATLAVMRKRWGLTAADMRQAAKGRSNHARLLYARLRDLIKTEDAAQVRQQWAAAILSPTQAMPVYRSRREVAVR